MLQTHLFEISSWTWLFHAHNKVRRSSWPYANKWTGHLPSASLSSTLCIKLQKHGEFEAFFLVLFCLLYLYLICFPVTMNQIELWRFMLCYQTLMLMLHVFMRLLINLSAIFFKKAVTMLKSFVHLSVLNSTLLKAATNNNLMSDTTRNILLKTLQIPGLFIKAKNELQRLWGLKYHRSYLSISTLNLSTESEIFSLQSTNRTLLFHEHRSGSGILSTSLVILDNAWYHTERDFPNGSFWYKL